MPETAVGLLDHIARRQARLREFADAAPGLAAALARLAVDAHADRRLDRAGLISLQALKV
jgi:hypothetical protein